MFMPLFVNHARKLLDRNIVRYLPVGHKFKQNTNKQLNDVLRKTEGKKWTNVDSIVFVQRERVKA